MKVKILRSLLPLLILTNCVTITKSKMFFEFDQNSKLKRIEKIYSGPFLLFGFFPLQELLQSSQVIQKFSEENQCFNLKNIDIEEFNRNYIILGLQRVRIIADCDQRILPL